MPDNIILIIKPEGNTLTISLNRPHCRNAIDGASAAELSQAFRRFEEDDNLHVAILTGTGGNFCAGADLKALAANPSELRFEEQGDGPLGVTRMQLSKPVIAAISGYAVAGGLELALWCDLRIADQTAIFGVFCRRWGVPLVDGGTIRLARQIGHSRAMDMILTGRPVVAEEALQMGLVNRVVKSDEALASAQHLAQQIAQFPQDCLRSDRQSLYEQWGLSFEEALANEFRLGRRTIASPQMRTGLERFNAGAGRHGTFHSELGHNEQGIEDG